MQLLFVISIVCFLALAGAGIALARRIRSSRRHTWESVHEQNDFAQHLFHAVEDGDSLAHRPVLRQTVQDVAARKSWNQPPEIVTVRPTAIRLRLEAVAEEASDGHRKPPQTAQGGIERLDWAYFNKDMGDLSDPYEMPRIRANSRISPRRY